VLFNFHETWQVEPLLTEGDARSVRLRAHRTLVIRLHRAALYWRLLKFWHQKWNYRTVTESSMAKCISVGHSDPKSALVMASDAATQ